MTSKNYSILSISFILCILTLVVVLNYIVDPYSFYDSKLLDMPKTRQADQIRLSKVISLEKIKPKSVILGTSRAEFGFDPDHSYMTKPSYNLSVGGSSVYETRLYLEHAIRMGNLERVLLVADYIMFNSNLQKRVVDLETYFGEKNLNRFLYSYKTTRSSFYTLLGANQKRYTLYRENGQREQDHNVGNIQRFGGLNRKLKSMTNYFSGYDNNNQYRDSGRNSFDDYLEILKLCYENNIDLVVVFGPNHVLQWESLDYYIGMDKWNNWKRSVVNITTKAAEDYNMQAYPVYDFSVYNEFTAEAIPDGRNELMRYHWEFTHYKSVLGDKVMDQISGESSDFGVALTNSNIDSHLKEQSELRYQYVKVNEYRDNVLSNPRKRGFTGYVNQDLDEI